MSRPHISELVLCIIWTISAIYLDRTNRAELRQAKRSDPCWITWVVNELTTWEDITYLKSSSSVEVISGYGKVTNDPVPLALFVTLATQPSNVFITELQLFELPRRLSVYLSSATPRISWELKTKNTLKNVTNLRQWETSLSLSNKRIIKQFLPKTSGANILALTWVMKFPKAVLH